MSPVAIALLYAVGLGLILAEVLTPGVVMGLIGVTCLGTAVYFTFTEYSVLVGLLSLAGTIVFTAATVVLAVRRLTLRRSLQNADGYESMDPSNRELLGAQGTTATPLRPSGYCRFGGRRVQVVTRGEPLEAEVRVKVIEVEGSRVVVRAT